jgi:hypothetical protein
MKSLMLHVKVFFFSFLYFFFRSFFSDYYYENFIIFKIIGLNGMQLQEKTLVVQRAHVGARKEISDMPEIEDTPLSMEALQNPDIKTILNIHISAAAMLGALVAHSPKAKPSRVIQLMNAFSREEIVDDDRYVDLYKDIEEEASKYGKVSSIVIPRPNVLLVTPTDFSEFDLPDSSTDSPGVGRVRPLIIWGLRILSCCILFSLIALDIFTFFNYLPNIPSSSISSNNYSYFSLTFSVRFSFNLNIYRRLRERYMQLEGANTQGALYLHHFMTLTNLREKISTIRGPKTTKKL